MNIVRVLLLRNWQVAARTAAGAGLRGIGLLFLLTFASSAWAQRSPRTCKPDPFNVSTWYQAYICLDDIVVADGAGYNSSLSSKVGGIYVVDPSTGDQTPISTGGYLGQAASVVIEPSTGKLLASTRTWGVIRVNPQDGSQEVLLRGGTGWNGGNYPTYYDSASNTNKSFVYPGGITIDPVDSSILVTDTGFDLTSPTCTKDINGTITNIATCAHYPARIIRIKKGQAPGVYAGTAVVSEASSTNPLAAPFDLVADGGGSLYVTDMNAKLGGPNDPGKGGIIKYLNASNGYSPTPFFSSYATNTVGTTGCPMGITINATGTIFATVFTYTGGFGCAPQAVFSLTPDRDGVNPPSLSTVVNGYPFQYPFGMDTDRSDRILIADEGSGYGCGGTIFRLDLTKPIVTDPTKPIVNLNPFAISPIAGGGCTPPNQAYLVVPSDVAVVKVAVTVNISNVTPVVSNLSATPAVEGGSSILSGTFTDPDPGQTHTVTISWGDGRANSVISLAAGTFSFSASHQYLDNGSYGISVDVADNLATGTGNTTALVSNANPVFGTVTGPNAPVALGSSVNVTGNFTDAGTKDTHTCSFTWDDGLTSAGTVSEINGSGSCTGSHNYTATGVYSVTVVVTEKEDGGTATSYFKYAVVFSTTEGSVTGNGWFKTLAGGYPSSAVDEGRTKFGLQVKYQAGAAVPSGKFQFQFKIGDDDDDDKHPERIRFRLQSTSFAWLVISGFESQFKGTGTLNGAGNYTFLVTGYDGQRPGGGGVDKLRVKIWETATGKLVYDNRQGSPDDMDSANPQPIGGGRVQIRN